MTEWTQETRTLELAWANRILCNENVLDGFGHLSARSAANPRHFLQSRYQSPQLVRPEDIVTISLEGEVIHPQGTPVYSERVMHGMIYEARPDVMAMAHVHALPLIPFSTTGFPLRPHYHMACMFWQGVPVFDDYDPVEGMLIKGVEHARRVARTLGGHRGMLLRGHGAIVVGKNIREVVQTTVALVNNAQSILQARMLGSEIKYLTDEECQIAEKTNLRDAALERGWNYFKERVPQQFRI